MHPGPQKIGGEYGEIRTSIGIDNLNAYLSKHTPSIRTPVDVKQFKVNQEHILKNTTYFFLFSSTVKYVGPFFSCLTSNNGNSSQTPHIS